MQEDCSSHGKYFIPFALQLGKHIWKAFCSHSPHERCQIAYVGGRDSYSVENNAFLCCDNNGSMDMHCLKVKCS